MRWTPSIPLQTGLLLALAVACALVSNGLAGPARRLGWGRTPETAAVVPPPAVPSAPPPLAPPAPAPNRPKPAKPVAPSVLVRFAPDPARPIREITPEDARALFLAKVPFLDARRSVEYAEGHIAGALNVSIWESTVDTQITVFEATVNPGSATPLVLYCSGGECEDSHLLAARLAPLGYRNLLLYRGGYPDWIRQGHPSRTGDQP